MGKRNNNLSAKKVRQYRSNQGRSPKKMAESYKVIFMSFVIIILIFTCMLILNQLLLHTQINYNQMGKSSEKFMRIREEEQYNKPLSPPPTEFIWKEYFTMLGQQYNYEFKPKQKE